MRRSYPFFLSLVLLFSQLITACAAASPQPVAIPVTITFYKRGYEPGGKDSASTAIDQAVAAFEKSHADIRIKVVGVPWTANGDAQLEAAIASGQDIHVMSIRPAEMVRFARQGKLSNIEPYLTTQDQEDFYTNALDAARVDGKIYAWPLWVTAVSIFANTELFQQQGVSLPTLENPWNWETFVDAAKRLTFQRSDGSQVYGFTASSKWGELEYYPLFYIDGGRILSPDGKRFVQDSPEGLSALQKIADLYQVHRVTPLDFGSVDQATARQQFKDGAVAMIMSSPGFLRDLEVANFPLAVLPPPTGNLEKVITTGAFGMYAVYNSTDPQELKAAHEFARYLTGSQVAQDVPGWQLAPGLRKSNTSYATTPQREIIARLVSYGVYEPPSLVSDATLQRYGAELEMVIQGSKSPQEALAAIAPMYQHELDMSEP
ncbi:MAG: extracellular solute-binding protein [Chloroflexota bacterium]